MAGDTRVILEDLDSPIGEPDVHPTADQPVRHRVKGHVDFDVIVGMHLGRFPLGIFEWLAWQRRQRVALDLLSNTCRRDLPIWRIGRLFSSSANLRSR